MDRVAARVLFTLLIYQDVSAGILEQAFETVQQALSPRQPSLISQDLQDQDDTNSSKDATSIHFKNQDFKIVLGKSGLQTLDSILDKVFNFTSDLHEKNERFNLLSQGSFSSLGGSQLNFGPGQSFSTKRPIAFDQPSPHQFINVLNSALDIKPMFKAQSIILDENQQEYQFYKKKRDEISNLFNERKPKKRKRPILTLKDAPHYFDVDEGIFKMNKFPDNEAMSSSHYENGHKVPTNLNHLRNAYYEKNENEFVSAPPVHFQLPEFPPSNSVKQHLVTATTHATRKPEATRYGTSSSRKFDKNTRNLLNPRIPEKFPNPVVYTEQDLAVFTETSRY